MSSNDGVYVAYWTTLEGRVYSVAHCSRSAVDNLRMMSGKDYEDLANSIWARTPSARAARALFNNHQEAIHCAEDMYFQLDAEYGASDFGEITSEPPEVIKDFAKANFKKVESSADKDQPVEAPDFWVVCNYDGSYHAIYNTLLSAEQDAKRAAQFNDPPDSPIYICKPVAAFSTETVKTVVVKSVKYRT